MAYKTAGLLVLISASLAFPAPPGKKPPEPKSIKNVGWQLHGARVVNQGKTLTTREGTTVTGYQIEAAATPTGNSRLFAGTFQAVLTLFSPSQPMPGQTPGKWYVGGNWTITHPGAAPKQKVRENAMMARGTIQTQLSFDPRSGKGSVDALLRIPRLSAAGWRMPVRGVFSGSEKFEGTIAFALRSWK